MASTSKCQCDILKARVSNLENEIACLKQEIVRQKSINAVNDLKLKNIEVKLNKSRNTATPPSIGAASISSNCFSIEDLSTSQYDDDEESDLSDSDNSYSTDEFNFFWYVEHIKSRWTKAKKNNEKYRLVKASGIYTDADNYDFLLIVQPNGGKGYFTFNNYLCVGLKCPYNVAKNDQKWPITRNLCLALVHPEDHTDVLISKHRTLSFKRPGTTQWIFKFISLDILFGSNPRNFNGAPYVSNDRICIGVKFID